MDDPPEAPRPPTSKELKLRAGLIDTLAGEVDRQLESVGARSRSMSTRASLLVGAASIVTGLQLLPTSGLPWQYVVSVVAGVVAAVLGVIALVPRAAPEVPILTAERTFWNYSPTRAQWTLTHWKLLTLREQEKALKWRARIVVAGFAALTTAIIFAALAVTAQPTTNGDPCGQQPATCSPAERAPSPSST